MLLPDDNGEPATSQQIEDNFERTIEAADITNCLREHDPLVNHVIDYSEYVEAFRDAQSQEAQDQRPPLVIRDSILWSPKRRIDLSDLVREGVVGHSIQWIGVVLGPGVSGRETVFRGDINLYGATFHGDTDFDGAIFKGKAGFYSGATFRGPASFRDVQFRKDAYFHNKTTFHDRTSFGGATFGGSSDDSSEDAGEAYFHAGTRFLGEVDFEGATFNVKHHFRADTFKSGVSFKDAVFNVEARFGRVTFPGPASFENTQFEMEATFQNAVFNRKAIFEDAQFRQDVDFDGVQFAEGALVSFVGSIFDVEADFGGITFPGPAWFHEAQFNMGAFFQNAVFSRQAIFDGAQFRQHVEFDGVQFSKEDMVSFPGRLFYPEAALKRAGVSFAGSIFDVEAAFGGVTFPGPASFQDAQFNMGASFQKAVFEQNANFEGASFAGYLSFRDAKIQGNFRLVDTTWEGRADFRESMIAELDWNSDNRPTTVKGVFDARKAQFKSLAIKDVHFSDLADFSRATFGKAALGTEGKILFFDPADFSGTTLRNTAPTTEPRILFEDVIFEKAADFLRADFQADAIFVNNRFRGLLDFTNAPFAEHARLCLLDNRIGQLLMDREHLSTTQPWQLSWKRSADRLFESRFRALEVTRSGEAVQPYACAEPDQSEPDQSDNDRDSNHEHLQKIYRSIESSFRNANDRWGENEAWYLGTVASRKAGGRFWDIVLGILLDLPSRYGIDYVRALAVSVLLVLVFWPVYWFYFRWVYLKKHRELPVVNLAAPPDQRRAFRFRPFERLFHPTVRETRSVRPWQDALFLSCRAFFKLGLGSSYPPVLACLVYVEWVVGTYMLIHFLFVLKNTLPIALPFLSG